VIREVCRRVRAGWARWINGLLMDETGYPSTARVGLWVTLLVALPLIVADSRNPRVDVPDSAYGMLTTLFIAFASWAAGPRVAQYIASHGAMPPAAEEMPPPSEKDPEEEPA